MQTKLSLTIEDARRIMAAAEEAAKNMGFNVSIAVVDCTTYPQLLTRMDGAPLMSAEGALDKARSAAEGGHPTTFFEEPLNEGRYSVLRLPHTPIPGGLPLLVDDQCVGAIGVAGAPPHLDVEIAQAGVAAL